MSGDNLKIIIPEINADSGLRLCRGNLKLYVQSLRLFTANMPATVNKMRSLLQQENVSENSMKDYSRSVHSLKGMCEYIGADEARKSAKQLEDMADLGDINGIRGHNEIFIKQIELIISSIQTWFDNNSNYLNTMIAEQKNG